MTQTNEVTSLAAEAVEVVDATEAVEAVEEAIIRDASIGGDQISRMLTDEGRYRFEVPRLLLADSIALLVSMGIGLLALTWCWPNRVHGPQFPRVLVFIPMFLVGLALHGVYWQHRQRLRRSAVEQVKRIALALGTGVLLALAADAVVGSSGRTLKLSEAVAFALPAVLLVPLCRAAYFRMMPVRSPIRLLIVGNGPGTAKLQMRLKRCSEISVVGIVDDGETVDGPVLGNLSALREIIDTYRVEWVVVGFPSSDWRRTVQHLRQLPTDVKMAVVPRYYELISWRSGVEDLHGLPVLHIAAPQLSSWAKFAKRAFDVIGATVALAVLSPVLLLAAVAIKLDSPGPVFFRQARGGRRGESFSIFKFRTMCDGAEGLRSELVEQNEVDGPIFKIRADPRVTGIGSLLRRTSVDELPQLLNVLLGQMSLVGPRPFPVAEARQIGGAASIRQNVLPGMTGLWQVSGRSDLSYEDLEHLDTLYVSSWSLFWDLRIIMQTPSAIFAGRGAF